MKIAISARGAGLGAWLDPIFEESRHLVLVDEEERFDAWARDGARGTESDSEVREVWLARHGANALVTGTMSREAQDRLAAAGIRVFTAKSGSVLELIEAAREGRLLPLARADARESGFVVGRQGMNNDTKMSERLNEVHELVGTLTKEFPSETKAFLNFLQKATDGEGLDVKTKELINVGLSVAAQCEWCIAFHVKNAVEAGATRAQIISAGFMAVVMHGGPALMYLTPLLRAADEFIAA